MKAVRFPLLAALVTLLSGCSSNTQPFVEVADVKQLMISVVEPAAEIYWDAVGTIIDKNGIVEFAPSTDEEWQAVRNAAMVIAESGNLLMMEGRIQGGAEWTALSSALIEVGQQALEAAEAENATAVFDAGAEVYYACSNCHATYAPDTIRPADSRAK
tara:strand:- start:7269 stop:7742 length:474 start_codon:yes stop_codon:yes gene_type:complete